MNEYFEMQIENFWLGTIDYTYGLEIQREHHALVSQDAADRILGLEHPLVITIGKRGSEDDLVIKRNPVGTLSQMNENPVMIITTDRGGQATVHNEGQLVIYPIVDLQRNKLNVQEFICRLILVTKRALAEIGVKAESGEAGVGLFTVKGKIASIGLRVDRGVTRHGLSININNDLKAFHRIKTCGIYERSMSSVQDFNINIECKTFFNIWIKHYICASLENRVSMPRTLNDFCFKELESEPAH